MNRGRRSDPIEQAIEHALRLGDFIDYGASWSFVSELKKVETQIGVVLSEDAEHAIDLYETFIAGSYEKAEEIDDSDGNFGTFVESLFCSWIEARQAAGSDTGETAGRLLGWMENDDYGFCHRLEHEAVKILNKKGLSSFASQVRARFDAAAQTKAQEESQNTSYLQRHWGGVLKTVYAAQRDVDAYLALCEKIE